MDYLLLSLAFLFGILLQSYFMVRGKLILDTKRNKFLDTDWMDLIVILFFSMLSFLTMFYGASLGSALIIFSIFFLIFFTIFFRKKFLTIITEKRILQLNLLVMYLFIVLYYKYIDYATFIAAWQHIPFLVIILGLFLFVPTIGTLVISFTYVRLTRFWKIFFYMWFLAMNVMLVVYQCFFVLKNILLTNTSIGGLFIMLNVILLGMTALILSSNFLSLMTAFDSDFGHEIRELFNQNYSDNQISKSNAIIMILAYLVPLLLNNYLQLIPEFALINILLLFTFFSDYFKEIAIIKN